MNNTSYLNATEIVFNDSYSILPCLEKNAPYLELYSFIVNGILLNFIGFLGIFGNIISMIILSRPQMRSSINCLLIGLARIDTALIITSILLFGLPGIYPYTGLLFTYYYKVLPHIIPVVYPLATIVQTSSAYLTLTVSLERFVAVCHPLRARSLCTCGRARIYVVAIIVFSLVYNFPRFWEAIIHSGKYPDTNITVYCAMPSEMRSNEIYMTVYVHWCYFIFLYLIPFFSLAVLNLAIYRQILKANRERQRLSRLQRCEIGLATMLMCVVAVFFVCNLLPLVVNIIEVFKIDVDNGIFELLVKTSNLLVTINSSVNFVIYVIFGEKFKRLFLMLFCNNSIFSYGTGRDSPDGQTHDDSYMSCGDRQSLRLHRQNTNMSRNGISIRLNGNNRSSRTRAASPGPCVYYPANRNSNDISTVTYATQVSLPNSEWEPNGTHDAGF